MHSEHFVARSSFDSLQKCYVYSVCSSQIYVPYNCLLLLLHAEIMSCTEIVGPETIHAVGLRFLQLPRNLYGGYNAVPG